MTFCIHEDKYESPAELTVYIILVVFFKNHENDKNGNAIVSSTNYLSHFKMIQGLYSEATSNGFLVDNTPPVFIRKPALYNEIGSIIENSIVYRSCFKVTWEVSDEESFIERQYISVISHRGGEINTTSTEVNATYFYLIFFHLSNCKRFVFGQPECTSQFH